MITKKEFAYAPGDQESERASNSYLMSLIALMAGLPLPIINLIATLIFYLGNRKSTYFVRWHCTQALLSQLLVLPFNSAGFWWTWSVVFGNGQVTNQYIAYMITIFCFNLTEFIVTVMTAVKTRRGQHLEWWLISDVVHLICKR